MRRLTPKGEPVLWIHGRQRRDLELTVGTEASDLLFRSRRYYYVGLLLMLTDFAIFLAALETGHTPARIVMGFLVVWVIGATVTLCGYLIAKRGARSASDFISANLGYAVRFGDVGPPANWQRRIIRTVAIHEGQDSKRWWE